MRKLLGVITACCFLIAPGAARAMPAFEFTSNSSGTINGANVSIGFGFTTNSATSVVALDAFGLNAAGSQVRLYDSTGTTLASATVLSTDPTEGAPFSFHSHAITPVALSAGQTYYVAEDYVSGDPAYRVATAFTTVDPSVTYGGAVSAFGLSANPTTDPLNHANAYFGPNLDVAAAVPEPSSFVLCGIAGAIGFGVTRHRRRRVLA